MSTVHAFPVPEMHWSDWAKIFVGLGIGVGTIFHIISWSLPENKRHKVYNLTNFWLILSGVIHVSDSFLLLSAIVIFFGQVWIEFNFVYFRNNSSIKTGLDMYAAAGIFMPLINIFSLIGVWLDYRYGHYGNGLMESGTHAMEAITALIDGPLCFLVVFAAAHDYGCRHPLQIILCVMQLYGLLWFTLQPIYSDTGVAGHFSSDPALFWGIAVGCNAPWGIFPTILLAQSFVEVSNKMAVKDRKRD